VVGLYFGLKEMHGAVVNKTSKHTTDVTKDMIFGNKDVATDHHATPMPDGEHYISGIRICTASSDDPEIVGLQVTTTSTETGLYTI
jgi:hypothetical protein